MHREYYRNGILGRIDMFRNPENHSQEEVEANAFAANLLMPEQMVREMWKRWGFTDYQNMNRATSVRHSATKEICQIPADTPSK